LTEQLSRGEAVGLLAGFWQGLQHQS